MGTLFFNTLDPNLAIYTGKTPANGVFHKF